MKAVLLKKQLFLNFDIIEKVTVNLYFSYTNLQQRKAGIMQVSISSPLSRIFLKKKSERSEMEEITVFYMEF